MPDSSVAGYLLPTSTAAQNDLDLDDILQQLIVGVTGLPKAMVRPRMWPTTPIQPELSINWAAVGITNIEQDANPYITHDGTGQGTDTLIRHERISGLVSIYGPRGQEYASIARDGLYLPQNHDTLKQFNMSLVGCGPIRSVPELMNKQGWRRRYDFGITLRRKVTRTYSIENITSAEFILESDFTVITDEPPYSETTEVSNT